MGHKAILEGTSDNGINDEKREWEKLSEKVLCSVAIFKEDSELENKEVGLDSSLKVLRVNTINF